MDDRVEGGPVRDPTEPPAPGRGVNLALRYLGIILPLVVTYWLGLWLGLSWGSLAGMQAIIAFGAALWIGFAAVLGLRRDWAGVGAITVFYVLVDAWLWLPALGVLHFD
ncbi:MAG: hypothetical protein V1912_00485 [bacterium]